MVQVNIFEIKNRLSCYRRLVRGGEQIEILDRKIPLARIIHVPQSETQANETLWIKEVERLGIVTPPQKKGFSQDLLAEENLLLTCRMAKASVLEALLEERNTGK